jgi:hypothetical protein
MPDGPTFFTQTPLARGLRELFSQMETRIGLRFFSATETIRPTLKEGLPHSKPSANPESIGA